MRDSFPQPTRLQVLLSTTRLTLALHVEAQQARERQSIGLQMAFGYHKGMSFDQLQTRATVETNSLQ